jgi:signal transduction histidine kinase
VRRRLGLVALAVASLIVIAFVVPLGVLVRELARDRALAGAERDAQLIAVFVAANRGDPDAIRLIADSGEINSNDLSVILRQEGPSGPLTVIGSPVPDGEDLTRFFSGTAGRVALDGGEAVYVPAFADNDIAVVRILVESENLTRGVDRAWLLLGVLAVVLIGISAVIAAGLARSIVRPVEDLSNAAERLGRGDLSTRVEPAGPPEIREVGAEFNRLAEQVSTLLETERETAADLSHRLRTPLAAIGLDVERLPPGPDQERLLDDVAELQRSIDFVIHTVRRPGRPDLGEVTDLTAVVAERMDFWDALAEEQARETSVNTPPNGGPAVKVSKHDLEAVIDALVGNVFAHTEEGVAYAVICEASPEGARLIVDDGGPGFGGDAVERGRSGGGSTGLGLDIARRTAESTGGSLSIGASPLGGARVVIEFRG